MLLVELNELIDPKVILYTKGPDPELDDNAPALAPFAPGHNPAPKLYCNKPFHQPLVAFGIALDIPGNFIHNSDGAEPVIVIEILDVILDNIKLAYCVAGFEE